MYSNNHCLVFSHSEDSDCYSSCDNKYGDISNTVYTMPYESNPTPWNSKQITTLNIENKIKPTNMDAWFCSFGQFRVSNVDLSSIDTSNCTSMKYTLSGLMSNSLISFTNWDTSNVTDMSYMFYTSPGIQSLDLSHFNTSKVTTMEEMFGGCQNLTNINLSNFDTGNCERMVNMFQGCNSLQSLNISSFNTSKVKSFEQMFVLDSSLTTITYGSGFVNTGLTGQNTTREMFGQCPANKPSWW